MEKRNNQQHNPSLKDKPTINPSVDIQSVELDPKAGFVFSRIDGILTVQELMVITGMSEEETMACLAKLNESGIIYYKESEENSEQTEWQVREQERKEEVTEVKDVELSSDQQKRIEELYLQMNNLNHYQLLGASPDSGRKEIKKIYLKFSREFHPDQYFGMELGPYKEKIDEVFKRIYTAYDVLYDPSKRKEYDNSLKEKGEISSPKKRERTISGKVVERIRKGRDFYEKALESLERKKYKEANNFIQLALNHDSENAEYRRLLEITLPVKKKEEVRVLKEQATEAYEIGNYRRALEVIGEAFSLNPDDPDLHHQSAKVWLALNRLKEAKEACIEALKSDQNNPEYHFTLGKIYRDMGLKKVAHKEFRRVLNLEAEHAGAQEQLRKLGGK